MPSLTSRLRDCAAAFFLFGVPAVLAAQPVVLTACYIPTSGTVYRIKAEGVPAECAKPGHVQFSWTDGAGPAGGDLAGALPAPTVARLQGRAVAATAPANGQLLGWNGALARWEPTAAPGGGKLALPYSDVLTSTQAGINLHNQGTGHTAMFYNSGGGTAVAGDSKSKEGVFGSSPYGVGVRGYAYADGGIGVSAQAHTTAGTALEIARGGIRVKGAGVATPTAALRMTVGCKASYIDNPLSNGRPDAIILVTAAQQPDMTPFVEYDAGAGKWMLKSNLVPKPFLHLPGFECPNKANNVNLLIVTP